MYEKATCSECGAEMRSRVAGFRVSAVCLRCGSGKIKLMSRELNAPAAIETAVTVENMTDSERHRRRTVVGVDTGRVEAERAIALEERKARWQARALWIGAACGYAALVIELWRMGS